MFLLRWLFTLSLYYWLFFIATVIFDFCPKDTFVGKIIKQYQIQLAGNPDTSNNKPTDNNTDTSSDSLDKLLKDYITNK
jgi:hypothetical protein